MNEEDVVADLNQNPYRLEFDEEEWGDLPDAEDYGIVIKFADWLGDLPNTPITLSYSFSGEGDFANVAIDEVIYEYEDDDECVFERSVSFDGGTITIPVDPDLGTVPEEIEIVAAFNLAGDEATDGGFSFSITSVSSSADVLFNDVATFEYEILETDPAGAWVLELATEADFERFKTVFAPVSSDLAALSFADITGEVAVEFDYVEVKFEVELVETEVVEECSEGEIESEEVNVVVEIEAEYGAEEGEFELEGSYFNEDGEELDFILEGDYELGSETISFTFKSLIDEDNFKSGEELYTGDAAFTLVRD